MEFKHNDGGRSVAGFKGSAGDCVCRSIAIATGKPYDEVYEVLAKGNASQRITKHVKSSRANVKTASRGINVKRKWFRDYMASLGFTWIPTMGIGTGCKVHLVKDELPMGTLVVAVSKHYTCVIDGVINDTWNPDRDGTRCVYGYWKLN